MRNQIFHLDVIHEKPDISPWQNTWETRYFFIT